MRKFVTLVALVSFIAATVSCDNNEAKTETKAKKPSFKQIFSQKGKTETEVALTDSTFLNDTLTQTTEFADGDSLLSDSLANKLPIPENETDIDWTASDKADTLDYSDNEISDDATDANAGYEEEIEYDDSQEEYINYSQGDITLSKERILKTEIVAVQFPEIIDERDSVLAVIEERMTLNPDKVSKQIVVEKWYSPVNYRGYKFNRKKLMLYGMEKAAPVGVYFYLGEYYLSVHKRVYDLDETTKNRDFKVVSDSVLATYLLNY